MEVGGPGEQGFYQVHTCQAEAFMMRRGSSLALRLLLPYEASAVRRSLRHALSFQYPLLSAVDRRAWLHSASLLHR